MKNNMTLVHYFIPEDLDDQEQLNAFTIKKSIDEITLLDISKNFPIRGEYIFRFKFTLDKGNNLTNLIEKKQFIWLDLTDAKQVVPQYGNKIVMKATRVSWEKKGETNLKAQVKQENINQKVKIQQQDQKHQHLSHSNSEPCQQMKQQFNQAESKWGYSQQQQQNNDNTINNINNNINPNVNKNNNDFDLMDMGFGNGNVNVNQQNSQQKSHNLLDF
ncbi:hypothetical protein PPERSA_07823 [Pseudocohnilembus persalinus]|uniref:DIX domain-containing protein n=1 Tax=Pseudocohnilembus persalinus TaxID=266149 RepID=A0A0V0QC42_PSEPJ|nr:hypothetical protein PPERSA_07823 [Pseudocohnilembus persalinus]|eukprot:KRW99746.1 hypothetical protein PPERSA_07823 [Pseudocohnilembus persalinus]